MVWAVVFVDEDARETLGPDHKGLLVGIEVDERPRLLQSVYEPGAGGLEVEGTGVFAAKEALHDAGRRRERHVVGRGGRKDYETYLIGAHARHLKGCLGRLRRHGRSRLALLGDVPRVDASVRVYPLVGSVKRCRDVVVGNNLRRQITACS